MKKIIGLALITWAVLFLSACASETVNSSGFKKGGGQPDSLISSYEVNFEVDSVILDAEAQAVVSLAARVAKRHDARKIIVTGYADSSGSAAHNLSLSKKRAKAVAKALRDKGLGGGMIKREAKGETDLAYSTPDDIKFKENRRVLISLYK